MGVLSACLIWSLPLQLADERVCNLYNMKSNLPLIWCFTDFSVVYFFICRSLNDSCMSALTERKLIPAVVGHTNLPACFFFQWRKSADQDLDQVNIWKQKWIDSDSNRLPLKNDEWESNVKPKWIHFKWCYECIQFHIYSINSETVEVIFFLPFWKMQ